jgi:amphi-Trp domain-containing protein
MGETMVQKKFSYDSIQDVASVKKYIKSLLRSLEDGNVVLSSEEGSIDFIPTELLHFSVKARKRGRKNKISLELRWTEQKEKVREEGKSLKITS